MRSWTISVVYNIVTSSIRSNLSPPSFFLVSISPLQIMPWSLFFAHTDTQRAKRGTVFFFALWASVALSVVINGAPVGFSDELLWKDSFSLDHDPGIIESRDSVGGVPVTSEEIILPLRSAIQKKSYDVGRVGWFHDVWSRRLLMTSRGDVSWASRGRFPRRVAETSRGRGGADVHTIRVLRLRGVVWVDVSREGLVWTRVPRREWGGVVA